MAIASRFARTARCPPSRDAASGAVSSPRLGVDFAPGAESLGSNSHRSFRQSRIGVTYSCGVTPITDLTGGVRCDTRSCRDSVGYSSQSSH